MCDGNDCCRTLAKVILIIVNLFFFLLGLLMLAFGIALVAAPDKVAESVFYGVDLSVLGGSNYVITGGGIFMIVLGAIVILIGAFGFFGACCENRVLLILYLIIVILILLAEVALIIFAAVFPNAFMDTVKTAVRKTLITSYSQDLQSNGSGAVYINSSYEFGYSWAATQIGAKCCGIDGPSDYGNYSEASRTIQFGGQSATIKLPLSCCKLKDDVKFPPKSAGDFNDLAGCVKGDPNTSYNTMGCFPAIEATIRQAAKIAIGIAAAIVGLEILIIIFGFILCCALDRSKSMTV